MSSRPIIAPYQVLKNADMSATQISPVTVIQNISLITYTYSWAGTSPVGVVSVQVSNDYAQNAAGAVSNAGTWNTLPLSSAASISGNSGNGAIDIQNPGAYAIRTVYTPTSGVGQLQATISSKVG